MYLKSLTLLGFKSFPEKTALAFQPGITAIVGPNGCGKSNVADAIRWVLGEQSARALRGGEMADVIFNGTDARKSLAMAEVSLTIGDVDQEHLRAAGVELAYNEVTVTRRVFRDGRSEYFVNRTPCRLKDIQQLFMGTGVGRTSYSIMAQGNITQILSSRPEDRRLVFEEAAGITKYKAQKRESLRKLEVTEQNLLRVSDLIREVKRQIGSLQRQAGKARRYKQLMLELQHLDTQLMRHEYDVLQCEIREHLESIEQLRQELEATSARGLRDETEIAQLREQLTDWEHQISQSQQRGLELCNQIERHEHRIQFNEERLRETAARHTAALAEVAQAEERRGIAEQELAGVAERLEQSQRGVAGQRDALSARQQALHGVEAALAREQQALREAQSQLFRSAQQVSRLRNEVGALDLQKQGNLARLEKLSAEKIQLEEERTRLEARLAEFAASVAADKETAHLRRVSVEGQQQRLRELQLQLEQTASSLDSLVQQQAGARSRLGVIEQLQAEHEGFGAGALAALQHTDEVLGSLADRIRVPDPYVVAIETALGHHLQLVLTEQPETARGILADLQERKRGRASIAPLAFWADDPGSGEEETGNPHGEPALKMVEAEPCVQPLLRRLLGRTRVVPSLESATAAWRNGGRGWDYVTLTGEMLTHAGVFTGGYLNGSGSGAAPSSILGRKNQIAQLQAQLGELHEQIGAASRAKGALQGEATLLQATLHEEQNDLRVREVAIATREGEVTALRNSVKILHQRIDTVVFEIQSLAAQDQEGERKRTALSGELSAAEDEERRLQEQLNGLNRSLETLGQERESAGAALTETRVTLATLEQEVDALRKQRQPLEVRIGELRQLAGQRRGEIADFLERQATAQAEIEESRQKIGSLQHQREQASQQTAALEAQRDSLSAELDAREESLRALRHQLTALQEKRGALEVELAQRQMSAQNVRERVQQKYQVNLDDVRSECITITLADQGPPKIRTLTPEEMAAAGVSTDWAAVAEQVSVLQQRVDEMGPVNLVAIDEYEETEQRYQFLSKQHDDLVQAKNQLHEVISRINTQTRQMFTETFEKIRDNFRGMFTEVFGGGKADLRLVDDGDVLESGIEIVARPPGKQLQTISLLSGGEQTMTAVSLLFAIYQVKPSPFCVLDELDAPLDESNINRFIRILQRFLEHSQFIIITHNKRTIGMADVLYGVTMQEQGVSKIVSVKFHRSGAIVTDHAPTPLVPPPATPPVEDEEDAAQEREETLEMALVK